MKFFFFEDLTNNFFALQIGTTDSVMGLHKALTEKLIHEALVSP
jgi:hypothetical protein